MADALSVYVAALVDGLAEAGVTEAVISPVRARRRLRSRWRPTLACDYI
ncbi:hypothetical protein LR69_03154 [Geobacillus sp. BCO2]|nr:hypothetical protein LR69_03154 [Geobacillus sp. BCO2]